MNELNVAAVTLPNGAKVYVRSADAATELQAEGRWDIKEGNFDDVANVIEGICDSLHNALLKAKPNKASVEFDLELTWKAGNILALFAKPEATGDIKVIFEWGKTE